MIEQAQKTVWATRALKAGEANTAFRALVPTPMLHPSDASIFLLRTVSEPWVTSPMGRGDGSAL